MSLVGYHHYAQYLDDALLDTNYDHCERNPVMLHAVVGIMNNAPVDTHAQ
jgi:hypothetical protein